MGDARLLFVRNMMNVYEKEHEDLMLALARHLKLHEYDSVLDVNRRLIINRAVTESYRQRLLEILYGVFLVGDE